MGFVIFRIFCSEVHQRKYEEQAGKFDFLPQVLLKRLLIVVYSSKSQTHIKEFGIKQPLSVTGDLSFCQPK